MSVCSRGMSRRRSYVSRSAHALTCSVGGRSGSLAHTKRSSARSTSPSIPTIRTTRASLTWTRRRANGAVLFEVSNRGEKAMLAFFNHARGSRDPSIQAEVGDGLLMRLGFTLVWVGWQFDVPRQDGLMRLYAPIATESGKPITGLVRSDFVLPEKAYDHSLADANHIAYPVLDPQGQENILTVRDTIFGQRHSLPRSEWQFARTEDGKVVPDLTRIY